MTKLEELLSVVESLRRKEHSWVDEDCWYSCPMHPEYCGNEGEAVCLCGLEEHNQKVDKVIALIKEL